MRRAAFGRLLVVRALKAEGELLVAEINQPVRSVFSGWLFSAGCADAVFSFLLIFCNWNIFVIPFEVHRCQADNIARRKATITDDAAINLKLRKLLIIERY